MTSGATGARDVVVVAGGCVVVVVGTVVVGRTATDMRLRRKIQQQQQIKATRSFMKTTDDSTIARQQTTDEAKIKQRTQTNNMYKPRSHACFAAAIQYFFLDGEGASGKVCAHMYSVVLRKWRYSIFKESDAKRLDTVTYGNPVSRLAPRKPRLTVASRESVTFLSCNTSNTVRT